MEKLLECASVLALAAVDVSLAMACGLLLTGAWLRRACDTITVAKLPALAWTAAALVVALGARFYLLAAVMGQDARPTAVFSGAGEVAATHAGTVALWTLGAACALLSASLLVPRDTGLRTWVLAALLAAIVVLHAAMGHAASSGDFTREETWQLLHLAGMALWSGAVMVGGFWAAPRMPAAEAPIDAAYLRALSWTSTGAVAAIVLSGSMRAWTGLDAHLGNLVTSGWGWILIAKLALVAVALGLGFMHRRAIHGRGKWTREESARFVATLRVEALCLLLVLLLSAWLASADLPGE